MGNIIRVLLAVGIVACCDAGMVSSPDRARSGRSNPNRRGRGLHVRPPGLALPYRPSAGSAILAPSLEEILRNVLIARLRTVIVTFGRR